MGCVWKRCAADRIHNTITKNLYTSEKQNKIIYTKKRIRMILHSDSFYGSVKKYQKIIIKIMKINE